MTDPRKDFEAWALKVFSDNRAFDDVNENTDFVVLLPRYWACWQAALASRPLSQEGRDAARYRFLMQANPVLATSFFWLDASNKSIDAAIDQAMETKS